METRVSCELMEIVSPPATRISEPEAARLARELFGLEAQAEPLPSERDYNFLLRVDGQPHSVLKLANTDESRAALEAQNAVLAHIARRDPELSCPRVLEAKSGEAIVEAELATGTHLVRLLSYLPGKLLAHVRPHNATLLERVGRFFGRLDRALEAFSHPALERELYWDLRHAGGVISENLEQIDDPARRTIVESVRERFEARVEPALSSLRTGVIHNDGNDYNILVSGFESGDGTVSGVIDFGDMVHSCTAFEVAVCAAYAILGKIDPLTAASAVVQGYHAVYPLTEVEIELLHDLITLRLALSVCVSARRRRQGIGDEYIVISESEAWEALERLDQLNGRMATYAFRAAAGLDPRPETTKLVEWLNGNSEGFAPVVEASLAPDSRVDLALAAGGTDLVATGDPLDYERAHAAVFDRMAQKGVKVAVGRYDEPRGIYVQEAFRPAGSDADEWRTVHLGIDLFMEPGSPVFAPLDGVVHGLRDNAGHQDYGPTVVLRHSPEPGLEFFTLYGHLSRDSLERRAVGDSVSKGERIGSIGTADVNGGWPPHLHFQIVTDMLGHDAEFPGVCAQRDRAVFRRLSPDPNLVLSIPELTPAPRGPTVEELMARRARHIGPSLGLHYRRPLVMVQGHMQYLYDHLSRRYLDCVNNVCHVGHCHPRVVAALAEQAATLNTNTRYLHERLVKYAERLSALLPDPLEVCYFVCSGSEANDLALRLARAHTGGSDFIVLEGAYHGNTTALIDISPYKFDGPGGEGAPPHVRKVPMPDPVRGDHGDWATAGPYYAGFVRDAREHAEEQGRRVAAFVCESLLGCGGQVELPPGYLEAAYGHARAGGAVCIADEVQVGFGRPGTHFWGFETQEVVPDIVTLGKPMGNGHPLAAVVTTRAIAESFMTGMEYFNTYGGNPVSCAVGLAVLDVIEQEGLREHAREVGDYLTEGLRDLASRHSLVGHVRGRGLFLGVELLRDRSTAEPATREAAYVIERMKDMGVLVTTDGPFDNVLKIKPPMVFTRTDAQVLVDCLDRVLSEPRLRAMTRPT